MQERLAALDCTEAGCLQPRSVGKRFVLEIVVNSAHQLTTTHRVCGSRRIELLVQTDASFQRI
jgi:hypothetical protein